MSKLENHKEAPVRGTNTRRRKSGDFNASITYLVKAGETLAAIAAKLSVPESQLKAWNPFAAASLRAGQRLQLYLHD